MHTIIPDEELLLEVRSGEVGLGRESHVVAHHRRLTSSGTIVTIVKED